MSRMVEAQKAGVLGVLDECVDDAQSELFRLRGGGVEQVF